jgi:hypothetical protein
MTESDAVRVVGDRMTHAVRLLGLLEAAAARNGASTAGDRVGAVLAHVRTVVADQREAFVTRLAELGVEEAAEATDVARDGVTDAGQESSPAAVLERLAGALAQVMAGEVRLYVTARLTADASTCELTSRHLRRLR